MIYKANCLNYEKFKNEDPDHIGAGQREVTPDLQT